MIINWSSFNESKGLKKSKNTLTKDLIEDYFVSIEDLGCSIDISYSVKQGDRDWCSLELGEIEGVNAVGWILDIRGDDLIVPTNEELDFYDFINYQNKINQITSVLNRINNNYDVPSIRLVFSDYHLLINFEKSPTLYDACFVSYDIFNEYWKDFAKKLPPHIDDSYMEFVEEGGNYYMVINSNLSNKVDKYDEKDLEKDLKIFTKDDFGSSKWDSIELKDSKYRIKNFISLDVIKFKY